MTVADSIPVDHLRLLHAVELLADNEHYSTLGNNSDSLTIIVYSKPVSGYSDLSIEQSVSVDSTQIIDGITKYFAAVDQVFRFALTIENSGLVDAENVVVIDYLPRHLFPVLQSLEESGGIPNVSEYSIRWDLRTIASGDTKIIYFDAIVTDKLPANLDRLTNRVTVAATNDRHTNDNESLLSMPVFTPHESCDLFTLDVNVFEPDRAEPLGINFELESEKYVRFDLYDLSGYRVGTLYNEAFDAGINRCEWDGSLPDGQKIGSGVYVITLLSDDGALQCRKKVVVRR